MSPQFVDFNADGHVDIVAGTFDGSPHVSLGSKEGFGDPTHILGSDGKRIMLEAFWNYDAKKWDKTTGPASGSHCTSAVALDWDNDKDFDLLLGCYKGGDLYLVKNEGTPAEPSFANSATPVLAGGKTLDAPGGLTTMRLVDWNADGLMDIVYGCFGKRSAGGGGVFLARNTGTAGAPVFAEPEVLIDGSPAGWTERTRPDEGLYPEPVDYDGDGDLDLVVGAYSNWTEPTRPLTEEEQARLAKLDEENAAAMDAYRELQTKAFEGKADITPEERTAIWKELQATAEYKEAMATMNSTRKAITELRPGPSRKPYVWVYKRK